MAKSKEKPLAVYRGGTFAENTKSYGKDRMKRDPIYRNQVFEAIEKRKQAGKAPVKAAVQNGTKS